MTLQTNTGGRNSADIPDHANPTSKLSDGDGCVAPGEPLDAESLDGEAIDGETRNGEALDGQMRGETGAAPDRADAESPGGEPHDAERPGGDAWVWRPDGTRRPVPAHRPHWAGVRAASAPSTWSLIQVAWTLPGPMPREAIPHGPAVCPPSALPLRRLPARSVREP